MSQKQCLWKPKLPQTVESNFLNWGAASSCRLAIVICQTPATIACRFSSFFREKRYPIEQQMHTAGLHGASSASFLLCGSFESQPCRLLPSSGTLRCPTPPLILGTGSICPIYLWTPIRALWFPTFHATANLPLMLMEGALLLCRPLLHFIFVVRAGKIAVDSAVDF